MYVGDVDYFDTDGDNKIDGMVRWESRKKICIRDWAKQFNPK